MASIEDLFELKDAPTPALVRALTDEVVVANASVHLMIANLRNMMENYAPTRRKMIIDMGRDKHSELWTFRALKLEQIAKHSENWHDFELNRDYVAEMDDSHGVAREQMATVCVLSELHDYIINDMY